MGKLVKPKVFFVGATEVNPQGLKDYLEYTGQSEFWEEFEQALSEGIPSGLALCSVYGKMCYKSLVLGKNSNVSKVRAVADNLVGTLASGHSSVFEHCQLNFIVTDCSRVYTHEQVRHRGGPPEGKENAIDNDLPGDGWAYSQTSGRYCRLDSIDLVWDDCLDPVKEMWQTGLRDIEDLIYLTECRLGLRKPNPKQSHASPGSWIALREGEGFPPLREGDNLEDFKWVPDDTFNFEKRKKLTSAIRRIAPNGQANELGLSVNLRALRHTVQVRTARFAEVEIRNIYAQIYDLVRGKFPTIFHDAKVEMVDGFPEVKGMVMQPYDVVVGDPKALKHWSTEDIKAELAKRTQPEDK